MALRATLCLRAGFFPLFRPAMVSEYSRRGGEEGDRVRMRLFKGFTYAVSLAVGIVAVVAQDYPGTSSTGRHVLTPLQTWMRGVYASAVTGEWGPPPALAEPQAMTGAAAGEARAPGGASAPEGVALAVGAGEAKAPAAGLEGRR